MIAIERTQSITVLRKGVSRMDQKQLITALEKQTLFSNEIKSILLELDTTQSSSTQAYLNDLLLIVRNRLVQNEHILDETTKEPLTLTSFEEWIRNEFTTYSSNMYFETTRA